MGVIAPTAILTDQCRSIVCLINNVILFISKLKKVFFPVQEKRNIRKKYL